MKEKTFIQLLEERKRSSLYRSRNGTDFNLRLNFSTNDYLGLAHHPEVIKSCEEGLKKYGVGSGAAQLLGGYSSAHRALEEELANFLGYEQVLLFSTGYMANVGVITALFDNKDTAIFLDRLSHASLTDGVRYSSAMYKRYRHLDMEDLIKHLNYATKKYRLIISEGVFSMDGDMVPLPELISIAKEKNCWFILDDAHGIGVLGDKGKGVMNHYGMTSNDVKILVGTFGKALGTFGGFVAGSKAIIDSLVQFARTYIYTAALPLAIIEATRASLKSIQKEGWRRDYLKGLIKRFKQGAGQLDLPLLPSGTPIQPLVIGDHNHAEKVFLSLKQKGILVALVRPPTVPANTSRLRISLTANHTEEDIDHLLFALDQAINGVG